MTKIKLTVRWIQVAVFVAISFIDGIIGGLLYTAVFA